MTKGDRNAKLTMLFILFNKGTKFEQIVALVNKCSLCCQLAQLAHLAHKDLANCGF